MEKQLEAVFENGVLRPLEPLRLAENTHVILSITSLPALEPNVSRQAELRWLEANRGEYSGQWVALSGNQLVSFGPDALAVHSEAVEKGVDLPLLVHLPPEPERFSIGWL